MAVSQLPLVARQRLVAPAIDRIRAIPPHPVPAIPVTAEQWERSLQDAALGTGKERADSRVLLAARDVADAAAGEARELRLAALALAERVASVALDLWCVAALGPGEVVVPLRVAVIDIALSSLQAAADATAPDVDGWDARMRSALENVHAGDPATVRDPVEALFDMSRDEASDARGVFSPARVIAQFHGREEELTRIVDHLLAVITPTPPNPIDGLRAAGALFLGPRPLLALRTAVQVRSLIADGLTDDGVAVAVPLRDLRARVDRSASNHTAMLGVTARLADAQATAEQAALQLDLYRRMIEGQLRPWAWTILRLRGRALPRMPELASLRDQLQADDHPLCLEAAHTILTPARNASAHEDFEWDSRRGVLLVGDDEISVDALVDATERAYSLMSGAECGWTCARAESDILGDLLDADRPPDTGKVIDLHGALARFGTNGLHVHDWSFDEGVLCVTVDDIQHGSIDPCFQAVLEASRWVRPDRVVVRTQQLPDPVIDLPREAIEIAEPVWLRSVASFRPLPLCTFLPANAANRLAVETPDAAARAIEWLALNDAAHAFNEAHDGWGGDHCVARLSARLELVAAAIAAARTLLPLAVDRYLAHATRLVSAAQLAVGTQVGAELADAEASIRAYLETSPMPHPLPTLATADR